MFGSFGMAILGDFLFPETKMLVGKKIPRFIRYKHGHGFLPPISQCLGVARAARRPLKTIGNKKGNKKLITLTLF
jgi:hypothetical protein